jgi:hypothetical protein
MKIFLSFIFSVSVKFILIFIEILTKNNKIAVNQNIFGDSKLKLQRERMKRIKK